MRYLVLAVVFWGLSPLAWADDWGLDQETGAQVQLQTVQADGYWGGYQNSEALTWTLGLDWNRTVALRGGLTARSVGTSAVYHNTVYPGYQGWGWVAAADWFALRTGYLGDSWAAGLSLGASYEYLSYPGLYKSFELPGLNFGLVGEVVPGRIDGMSFRLRVPVGVDQRTGFSLDWRVGAELSVVFRGTARPAP